MSVSFVVAAVITCSSAIHAPAELRGDQVVEGGKGNMAPLTRTCPFCAAPVADVDSARCAKCGRPLLPAASSAASAGAKTIFGYQAPRLPAEPLRLGQDRGARADHAAPGPEDRPPPLWSRPPTNSGGDSPPGLRGPAPGARRPPPPFRARSVAPIPSLRNDDTGSRLDGLPPPHPLSANPAPPSHRQPTGGDDPWSPRPGGLGPSPVEHLPAPRGAPPADRQRAKTERISRARATPAAERDKDRVTGPHNPAPPSEEGAPVSPSGALPAPSRAIKAARAANSRPDRLERWASRLPASPPGTLFGLPLARLRSRRLEDQAVLAAGLLLFASLFIPLATTPRLSFPFSDGVSLLLHFVWPFAAGAGYFLVALSRSSPVGEQIHRPILAWLPVAVAFGGILVTGAPLRDLAAAWPFWGRLAALGYSLLLVALLLQLDQRGSRLLMAAALAFVVPGVFPFVAALGFADLPLLFVLYDVVEVIVFAAALGCAAFIVADRVPALRLAHRFLPLVATVLLAWLPLKMLLLMAATLADVGSIGSALVTGLHGAIEIIAYVGVFVVTAPRAGNAAAQRLGLGQRAD